MDNNVDPFVTKHETCTEYPSYIFMIKSYTEAMQN